MASRTVSVREVFDGNKFTPYQYLVCTLCFLVVFLDGFDLTIIGVALPKIADFLHSKPTALGLALGAGQFGPLVGAFVLGTIADRCGRKWMLFVSAVIFGIFTVLTIFITSVGQLALFRFLAGFGLGGAIPNALTFGSEYAPTRARQSLVATMYAGMPTGAMIGGLTAAALMPHFGWQSLFVLGGGVPILIALAVALFLPESLEFLARQGKYKEQVRRIIGKVSPALANDKEVVFVASEKKVTGVPVKRLFTEGRALTTVLLWVMCSGALYMLWILNTWSPTLLKKSGASVQQYSLAYAFLCFGAAVSSIIIGKLMDKVNPFRVLQIGFLLGFVSLVAFGFAAAGPFALVAVLSVVCGLFINGSQTGTLAVTTVSYPSDIRATGIGWAYAIAKIGAMGAPAIGGVLLSWNWSVSRICSVQALVGIFVSIVILLLELQVAAVARRARKAAAEATPERLEARSVGRR